MVNMKKKKKKRGERESMCESVREKKKTEMKWNARLPNKKIVFAAILIEGEFHRRTCVCVCVYAHVCMCNACDVKRMEFLLHESYSVCFVFIICAPCKIRNKIVLHGIYEWIWKWEQEWEKRM